MRRAVCAHSGGTAFFLRAVTFGAVFLRSAAVQQDETTLVERASFLSQEDKELLNAYHQSFDDDKVDIDLIISLLCKIHRRSENGMPTILHFANASLHFLTIIVRVMILSNVRINSRLNEFSFCDGGR